MIKFYDIPDKYVSIHFLGQFQLNRLVEFLKAYGYKNQNEKCPIEELKILLPDFQNKGDDQWLYLDRSDSFTLKNKASRGKGDKGVFYEFKDIDFTFEKKSLLDHFLYKDTEFTYEDLKAIGEQYEIIKIAKQLIDKFQFTDEEKAIKTGKEIRELLIDAAEPYDEEITIGTALDTIKEQEELEEEK